MTATITSMRCMQSCGNTSNDARFTNYIAWRMTTSTKPLVGVSRCLLGDAVRYDGASKPCAIIIEQLHDYFELVPVCPEVEAGLGIPRSAVVLTGSMEQPRMTGRDDPALDVTDQILAFCEQRIPQLAALSGFIFKSRSPSCGLGSAPLFLHGKCVSKKIDGMFAASLRRRYPQLPVIDEQALEDSRLLIQFIDQVATQRTPVTTPPAPV